jgi:hypothetical protein
MPCGQRRCSDVDKANKQFAAGWHARPAASMCVVQRIVPVLSRTEVALSTLHESVASQRLEVGRSFPVYSEELHVNGLGRVTAINS